MDFRRPFFVFGKTVVNIIVPSILFLLNLLIVIIDMLESVGFRIMDHLNNQRPNNNERPEADTWQQVRDEQQPEEFQPIYDRRERERAENDIQRSTQQRNQPRSTSWQQVQHAQQPEEFQFQPIYDRREREECQVQRSTQQRNQSRSNPPSYNQQEANPLVQLLESGDVDTIAEAKLVMELVSLQFSRAESIDAAKHCSSVETAVAYLNQECESCNRTYPMSEMIYMLHCTDRCCEGCAKTFFTMQISHHSITDCICPYCKKPDLKGDKISMHDKKDYFANLSVVFKRVLHANVFTIYQRKLNEYMNTNTRNTNDPSEASDDREERNANGRNRDIDESLQQSANVRSGVQPNNTPTEFDIMQRNCQELLRDRKVSNDAAAQLAATLMSMKFTEEQALDAARNCSTFDNAMSYLDQQCSSCNKTYSMGQMTTMPNCDHRFCRPCTKRHFTENAAGDSIFSYCVSSTCQLPDLDNEDTKCCYLANLDAFLKRLLDADAHEQFLQKVEDFSLRNDPDQLAHLPEELKRQARQYLTDGRVSNIMQAELAIRLIQGDHSEEDALEAAKQCQTLDGALAFVGQECNICTDKFRMDQMVTMLNCADRYCTDCAKTYFTVQINEHPILDCNCPECSLPNLNDENMTDMEKSYYFANLDIILKTILEAPVHEVFQKKLRDWSLAQNPDFKWCPQCSSGYITDETGRVICPDCRAITCVSCRKLWEDQHEGISCERFAAWKEANDPEAQEAGVANHLAINGIDCPKCRHRFSLARGGCMHFTCSQCRYEFCQGCAKEFSRRCKVGGCTLGTALHAHHPRNCLYFLRDKQPAELQELLRKYNVPYETDRPANIPNMLTCSVVLQSGGRDVYCPSGVQEGHAGLCSLHYTEYLAGLIKTNNIDPVELHDTNFITYQLTRDGIPVPTHNEGSISPEEYKEICVKVIKERIPL